MRPVLLVLASTYPRWAHDHEPGFVHELARRLTGSFRVLALVPHAAGALDRETLDGVEVIRYRYAPQAWETIVNDGGIVTNLRRNRWKIMLVPGFVLAQAWHAWRLCRREEVDVVHAHWLVPQGVIAALLRVLPGRRTRFVVTSHGADLYALRGRVMEYIKRFVLRRASATTVVSGAMRGRLEAIGADLTKVSVRPMGVDMRQIFTPCTDVPRSEHEILFAGRLVEKKGVRHLLDAIPHVLERVPQAVLVVAGFGPEDVTLRSHACDLGIEASVRFLGAVPQNELPALYRRAAVFIAPFVRAASGDEEGLGLVLLEAIACGCPILAGEVPALGELLGGGFDDMKVDPHDTHGLARRIADRLEQPASARARAAELKEAIGLRFDWHVVSAGYADLLIATRKGGAT